MMPTFEYHEGSWAEQPQAVDATSSASVVYLRRNIRQVTKEDSTSGGTVTLWGYEEAQVTPAEYTAYLAEQTAARVEYIAMMSDINFEEG